MSKEQKTREMVSEAYAKAVQGSGGCCSSRPAYAKEIDKDVQSFGCGNPLAFAGVQPGETVLDLGSGPGLDLLVAAKAVGENGRVIGVDMTDEMIAKGRENTADHENIEIRKGLIEELPVEDGSVDWVISNCVINLSPEKNRVFAEIARVLKPGGRFSVSDIVAEDLPAWVEEYDVIHAACVAGAIPEADYVAGLRHAGLEDVAVTERVVYDADQICGIIESDLKHFDDLDAAGLGSRLSELEGKVASVRVSGRKAGPGACCGS